MKAAFEIAGHQIPQQDMLASTFGASRDAYLNLEDMPESYQNGTASGCNIASDLFYKGGNLAEHGRVLMQGVDAHEFYMTLRALLASFEPKHEQKIGTAGLLIDTYTVQS